MILAATPESGLTGLSGWVSDVIAASGEVGVGLLALLETVFPPIPSEIVLPLAGYLANRGSLDVGLVVLAATLGSLAGAWLLYAAGARLGMERSSRLIAALPLVDREDVDGAARWFERHGRWAVLFGRLVPGVRSLISLPAGATAMPLGRFTVYTVIGSAAWNSLLIGGGYALGTQYHVIERYAGALDRAFLAAGIGLLALAVARRIRRRRPAEVKELERTR